MCILVETLDVGEGMVDVGGTAGKFVAHAPDFH